MMNEEREVTGYWQRTRQRLYEILEDEEVRDRTSRVFNAGILALILLNVLAVMLETVQSIGTAWKTELRAFEVGLCRSVHRGVRLEDLGLHFASRIQLSNRRAAALCAAMDAVG